MPHSPPRAILMLCALCSGAIALAGLAGMAIAILGVVGGARQLMVWFLLGFEPVVLLAGVMGVLTGLARIRQAPALAMFCIGGSTLVAGLLIEPSLVQRALGSQVAPTPIAGVSVLPLALAQVGLSLCMFALAGLAAMMRKPSVAIPRLVVAALLALPVMIGVALGYWLMRGSGRNVMAGVPPIVTVIGVVFGGLIIGGFFSACVHYLITGFGAGLEQDYSTPKSGAGASSQG